MKLKKPQIFINRIKAGSAALLFLAVGLLQTPQVFAATTCGTTTTPATTYGQVKQSVSVSTAGTYRVWSRIKAPDTTNNSYYLQIDGGCAYKVGDSTSIPANQWVWVSYQGGNTSSFINAALTTGTRNLTFTGAEPNVELDKVMFVADQACVPVNFGDNCGDTLAPTISMTAPTASTVNAGTSVGVKVTATDNVGIAKVDLYVNGKFQATMTGSGTSYTYNWSTSGLNGAYALTAQATDTSGLTATSQPAVTVTVKGVTNPPPPPPVNPPVNPPPPPPPTGGGVPGDVNNDSCVDIIDYGTLYQHQNDNPVYAPIDFKKDGVINGADLNVLLVNWTGKKAGCQ